MTYKIYTGVPFFAVDVTPRGSEVQQTAAKDVISAMEEKGLSFFQTRIVSTFTPDDGMFGPKIVRHRIHRKPINNVS